MIEGMILADKDVVLLRRVLEELVLLPGKQGTLARVGPAMLDLVEAASLRGTRGVRNTYVITHPEMLALRAIYDQFVTLPGKLGEMAHDCIVTLDVVRAEAALGVELRAALGYEPECAP